MKDVKFEYLYNGQVIPSENLTSTHLDHAMGKNEYVIAGNFEHIDSVQDITLLVKANDGDFQQKLVVRPCLVVPRKSSSQPRDLDLNGPRNCFPSVFWNRTENEEFLDRLWAFKRINYLLGDQNDCSKGIDVFDKDKKLSTRSTKASKNISENCKKEATDLALKYNFVTDVTSMIVEEEDEYVNKGSIHVSKVGKNDLIEEFPVDYDFFLQESNPLSASTFSLSGG